VVWRRRDAGLASAIADGERNRQHRRRGRTAHLGARLGPMSCSPVAASARASCGGSVVDVYDAAGLTCRIKRVLPRSAERLKKHDYFPGFLPAHDMIDQRAHRHARVMERGGPSSYLLLYDDFEAERTSSREDPAQVPAREAFLQLDRILLYATIPQGWIAHHRSKLVSTLCAFETSFDIQACYAERYGEDGRRPA
jgi:hypothetical protein